MRMLTFAAALLAVLQLSCGVALAAGDWTWPVRGPVITGYRNGDDPYAAGQHRGIDIAAANGAPVVAATGGTVAFAGVVGSSGLTVSERTADGRYELSYLHLSATSVRVGAHVVAGDRVGAVGTTGRRSAEQPHLHFGVREAGARQAYRDPLDLLAAPPPAERPQPRPAPAPLPAPEAARPAPAPALAPVALPGLSAPATRVAPRAVHLPAQHPAAVHSSHPSRGAAPARGVVHAPALGRLLAAAPAAPAHATAPHAGPSRHGASALHADPARLPAAGPAGAPSHQARPSARRALARPHRGGGGVDLAWLAACLGLVAAATVLGRPSRGSRGDRPGLGSLLAPLLRRG